MKPYYSHAGIEIYLGDCREVLPSLEAVLLLTDIPYGEVSRNDNGLRSLDRGVADTVTVSLGDLLPLLVRAFNGTAYVWCGTEQVSYIRAAFVSAGATTRMCFWEKSNPSPMNGEYVWLSSVECCVYGKKAGATFTRFCASPVWRGPIAEPNGHPTPKPEWLMKHLILSSSADGDTVLDPFMGAGTTLFAAKELGRKAIGIELEERYCEIAAKRLAQETINFPAELADGGPGPAQLEIGQDIAETQRSGREG